MFLQNHWTFISCLSWDYYVWWDYGYLKSCRKSGACDGRGLYYHLSYYFNRELSVHSASFSNDFGGAFTPSAAMGGFQEQR